MPASRLLLRLDEDRFDAIEVTEIYFAEAKGGDADIRTRRKGRYRTTEHFAELGSRLPRNEFVRIHRSYLVRIDRVRQLRRRGANDWELKLEPPVNAVLPVARRVPAGRRHEPPVARAGGPGQRRLPAGAGEVRLHDLRRRPRLLQGGGEQVDELILELV